MSAHVLASEGVSLVKASKYNEGIEKLTQALKLQKAPMWLIERSKAYLRTNDFEVALHDAEEALSIALSRANRDLMIEAQIRRAVTLFRMNRYADTDLCAFWAIRLLDGAKASEDDGQQNKVGDNGNYSVSLQEIQSAIQKEAQDNKAAGIQTAMATGRSKDTNNRNLAVSWRINALTAMEKLELGAPGRKITVVKYPTPSDAPPARTTAIQAEKVTEIEDDDEPEEPNKPEIPRHVLTGSTPNPIQSWEWNDVWDNFKAEHKKHDVRTDWYESDTMVNISLFVKNVPKDSVKVNAKEQSVCEFLPPARDLFTNTLNKVTVSPIASIPTGSLTLPLKGSIKPDETTYTVKSMKIELVLQKAAPGKWRVLRNSDAYAKFDNSVQFTKHARKLGYKDASEFQIQTFEGDSEAWYNDIYKKLFSQDDTDGAEAAPSTASATQPRSSAAGTTETSASAKSTGPAYPTSSKSGPKNWDSMNLDADEEKEDNVDDFFKKLYKDADPDTRRAMMKSYVESNGTSLSTSWSEASKKNYQTEAPEGAVAKKWDE